MSDVESSHVQAATWAVAPCIKAVRRNLVRNGGTPLDLGVALLVQTETFLLQEMNPDDVADLLEERARAVRSGFAPEPASAGVVIVGVLLSAWSRGIQMEQPPTGIVGSAVSFLVHQLVTAIGKEEAAAAFEAIVSDITKRQLNGN